MIRFTKSALLAAIVLLGISITRGQTSSGGGQTSSAGEAPAPGTERARIAFLAGSFATSVSIPPGPGMPKGASGTGTTVAAWTLDSMFLAIDDASSLFGHYQSHGMLGFDPVIRQYVLSMFNNYGDHPIYRGNFAGDTLVLQTKVAAPKGAFDQKILWYRDGETVVLNVLNDAGRGFVPTLVQQATRSGKR